MLLGTCVIALVAEGLLAASRRLEGDVSGLVAGVTSGAGTITMVGFAAKAIVLRGAGAERGWISD